MPAIQEVNKAVALIVPGAMFIRKPNGNLYLVQPDCKYYPSLRWRLRDDGLWLFDRRSATFTGGTVVMSLVQLSRWLMDKPRRPLRYFSYFPEAKAYLETTDYTEKTHCVLCKASEPSDWWSLNGLVGPCCSFGKCRENRPSK